MLFTSQARDRKMAGDLDGARHYASTARCLNIWSTVLVSIGFLIFMIIIIVVAVKADQMHTYTHNSFNNYRPPYWNSGWVLCCGGFVMILCFMFMAQFVPFWKKKNTFLLISSSKNYMHFHLCYKSLKWN